MQKSRKSEKPVPDRSKKTRPSELNDDLASVLSKIMSDFEYTLIILTFGFPRWVELCMSAANFRGLTAADILILHAVNHRARDRTVSEICMVLNIDESHLAAYSLKKLMAASLVSVSTKGRERHYSTTELGNEACGAYRRVREEFLIRHLSWIADAGATLKQTENMLRLINGLYDQASRFATAHALSRPEAPPLHTKR